MPALIGFALVGFIAYWLARHPRAASDAFDLVTPGAGPELAGELTGRLSLGQVRDLAAQTVSSYGFGADPTMLAVMAFTESSGNAGIGVHPDGVSIGLMGVTTLAARDNAGRGHLTYPATAAALQTARGSMYHAAAYVSWLRSYGGRDQPDEWVIRAYNAGPTGANAGGGAAHLAAYRRRKSELGL